MHSILVILCAFCVLLWQIRIDRMCLRIIASRFKFDQEYDNRIPISIRPGVWAGPSMALMYFKRYRMEMDIADLAYPEPPLPAGYDLLAWDPSLLERHAEIKYRCFCTEVDAHIFPCLGDRRGCLRLMSEISSKETFVPEATWLATYRAPHSDEWETCGTVQGV